MFQKLTQTVKTNAADPKAYEIIAETLKLQ